MNLLGKRRWYLFIFLYCPLISNTILEFKLSDELFKVVTELVSLTNEQKTSVSLQQQNAQNATTKYKKCHLDFQNLLQD